MATQTILFPSPYAPSAVHVRPLAGGSTVAGAAITKVDDGLYSATFASIVGDYSLSLMDGATCIGLGTVFGVADDGGSYFEQSLEQSSGGGGATVATVAVPKPTAREILNTGDLSINAGSTLRISFTGDDALGSIVGRTKLWFTVKESRQHTDDEAILQVIEGTGLTRLNGAAPGSATWASITVADEDTGELSITIYASATKLLEAARGLVWDLKISLAASPDDAIDLTEGLLTVSAPVTRATT